MNTTLRKFLASLAVSVSLAAPALADDSFAEWASHKKLADKMYMYTNTTVDKGLKKASIENPRRVWLLSFYLYDTGSFEFNAMANACDGISERTASLTPKGANHFASKLAELGVPGLKRGFAKHGMELLTPVEFATTEEQRKAYTGFQLPIGNLGKAALDVAQWI